MMEELCRTCLYNIPDIDVSCKLNNSHVSSYRIKTMLQCCVPEFNLSLVENAIICGACVKDLHVAYNFKKKCLESDEVIKGYHNSNKKANSESVLVDRKITEVAVIKGNIESESSKSVIHKHSWRESAANAPIVVENNDIINPNNTAESSLIHKDVTLINNQAVRKPPILNTSVISLVPIHKLQAEKVTDQPQCRIASGKSLIIHTTNENADLVETPGSSIVTQPIPASKSDSTSYIQSAGKHANNISIIGPNQSYEKSLTCSSTLANAAKPVVEDEVQMQGPPVSQYPENRHTNPTCSNTIPPSAVKKAKKKSTVRGWNVASGMPTYSWRHSSNDLLFPKTIKKTPDNMHIPKNKCTPASPNVSGILSTLSIISTQISPKRSHKNNSTKNRSESSVILQRIPCSPESAKTAACYTNRRIIKHLKKSHSRLIVNDVSNRNLLVQRPSSQYSDKNGINICSNISTHPNLVANPAAPIPVANDPSRKRKPELNVSSVTPKKTCIADVSNFTGATAEQTGSFDLSANTKQKSIVSIPTHFTPRSNFVANAFSYNPSKPSLLVNNSAKVQTPPVQSEETLIMPIKLEIKEEPPAEVPPFVNTEKIRFELYNSVMQERMLQNKSFIS